jgi:hypothetical protein
VYIYYLQLLSVHHELEVYRPYGYWALHAMYKMIFRVKANTTARAEIRAQAEAAAALLGLPADVQDAKATAWKATVYKATAYKARVWWWSPV